MKIQDMICLSEQFSLLVLLVWKEPHLWAPTWLIPAKSHWEQEERSDESSNAAGDCAITQKMQVNVDKGRELWEAAKQAQQHLLERTVMQLTDHKEEWGSESQRNCPHSLIKENMPESGIKGKTIEWMLS